MTPRTDLRGELVTQDFDDTIVLQPFFFCFKHSTHNLTFTFSDLLISRLQVIAPDHCHHHIKRSFYIN
jgi:hypothetical protein